MTTQDRATIDDLYNVAEDGKADIVKGKLRLMAPTGAQPSLANSKIWLRLYEHAQARGSGVAVGDNAGFRVNLPERDSFSPDAAFYVGDHPGMKFFEGAPVLAVEVRSEGNYGPAAEREMADKREDYFAAGTLVVWDVDLLDDDVVKAYRSSAPERTNRLSPR